MYSSRIPFAVVSHIIRSIILLQWISITVVSSDGVVNEKMPTAAKLTISIDQVSPALPPQIAYFIPDSALNNFLNRTMLNGTVYNRNINSLRPPPRPPLRPDIMPPNNFDDPMFDSMAAPQNKYRYVFVPKNHNQDADSSTYEDADTAYQNYAYDIDYKPLKEKKSSYWRYQAHENEDDGHTKTQKKYVKKEKYPSSHKYLNYHPSNIRDQLDYLKSNHRQHFADDSDENDDVDGDSERIIDARGVGKRRQLKKKVQHKKKRVPVSPSYVPTSSYESDDRLPPYYATQPSQHHNHKNCKPHAITNNQDLAVDEGDYDDEEEVQTTVAPQRRKKSRNKGLTFYITKVHDPGTNTDRMLRVDKVESNDDEEFGTETAFVPTRYLASVRGIEKTVYKKKHRMPTISKKPRVKERLYESGGHVVYTEDGYEDKQYDHGSQKKYLDYHHRTRRETLSEASGETLPEASELKGQELIDHISGLIKNASETLTSVDGELKKRGRYPFYNSSKTVIKESPLRYAEHEEPFRANESNSYYATKTKFCDELGEDVNVRTDESDPSIPTKRLQGLGGKIDCVKEKLFGRNPLDNPIFREDVVSEPNAEAVFGSDSSVYTDVMHNIGYHKNQRVFSNYGTSHNYDLGAVDTNMVKNRPGNSLNTYETLPSDDINDSVESDDAPANVNQSHHENAFNNPAQEKGAASVNVEQSYPGNTFNNPAQESGDVASTIEEQTYSKNAFNNPAQVPILDISKFIPRPHAYLPAAPLFESDFVPITATTGRSPVPTTHMTPPNSQAVPVQIPVIVSTSSNQFYRGYRQPPRQNLNNNIRRLPPNVLVLRRGQTINIVRVPLQNKPRR